MVKDATRVPGRPEPPFGEVIERRCANVVYSPWLFTHGEHAAAGVFCRRKVEMAHFRDGIANGVVDCAFAHLSTFDVRHRHAKR